MPLRGKAEAIYIYALVIQIAFLILIVKPSNPFLLPPSVGEGRGKGVDAVLYVLCFSQIVVDFSKQI